MIDDYKPMEPVTIVTDGILAIMGFLFAALLLYYWFKIEGERPRTTLMWIGSLISTALFAMFGALSHGMTSITIGDILWIPTYIFGGVAFIFLVTGVMIYEREENYEKLITIPVVLVVIYLILGILLNWMFLLWVFLLVICAVVILFFSFKARKDGKELANYLILGLIIIIIAGVVQAIGGMLGLSTTFGPSNEFLFSPHNDIFHIIAIFGVIVLFIGFKKELS